MVLYRHVVCLTTRSLFEGYAEDQNTGFKDVKYPIKSNVFLAFTVSTTSCASPLAQIHAPIHSTGHPMTVMET
jgi:hypothetical protein